MKKRVILCAFVGLGLLSLNACIDHEVIPPPLPLVDLNCDCSASINDSLVSYSDSCHYSSEKVIVSGGVSKAQYQTQIEDVDVVGGLELEVRSINWIDDGSNNPSLGEFKTFFIDNPTPGFSGGINHNGVVIRWTDPNGNVWISDTTSAEPVCIQNFVFNTLIQESDTLGDWMQFDADVSCKLINSDYGVVDSVKCLTGGKIRSAFKLV